MIFSRLTLSILLLVAPLFAVGQTGPGPCHPYPGAVAQNCLELIGNNLNNDDQLTCDGTRRASLTLRNCSITVKCASGQTGVAIGDAARRALTTIGSCALNEYGSISGHYTSDDGMKICYLYPG
jgi:hypothetical protein